MAWIFCIPGFSAIKFMLILREGTLRQAHAIAERVHDSIEKNFPKVKHIMVHVNPGVPLHGR